MVSVVLASTDVASKLQLLPSRFTTSHIYHCFHHESFESYRTSFLCVASLGAVPTTKREEETTLALHLDAAQVPRATLSMVDERMRIFCSFAQLLTRLCKAILFILITRIPHLEGAANLAYAEQFEERGKERH
jgi:hypothetical protein